jgi:VIT1/CCC1 family predicted Fe2+/Mn2+ transporter
MGPSDPREASRVSALGSFVEKLRGRQWRIVPHPGPTLEQQRPAGRRSGALRAAIFGANDGLVSNAALIMGVAGAGQANKVVILAGIAGLLAGAFSMAAGEYISMRVQREVFERLIHLEAHELGTDPAGERDELEQIYVSKGISPELAARVSEELMRDPATALETHAREELGLDPHAGLGSPWAAAGSSFVTFAGGALVPLAPFVVASGTAAILASAGLTLVALFAIGGGMSILTGRGFVISALRMMLIGGLAGGITFVVGKLLDASTGL